LIAVFFRYWLSLKFRALALPLGECHASGMPNRSSKPKRPRDANQLAKTIVDIATCETEEQHEDEGKDPAAVALGRKGGLKGGKARAAKLSKKRRTEIAKQAARSRWNRR